MIPASLLTGIRKILHEFCRGDAEGLEAILDGAIADSDCQMGFPRHTMAKKIDSINLLTWMVVCDRGMRRQLPENTGHKTISPFLAARPLASLARDEIHPVLRNGHFQRPNRGTRRRQKNGREDCSTITR